MYFTNPNITAVFAPDIQHPFRVRQDISSVNNDKWFTIYPDIPIIIYISANIGNAC
jgi:hypothetical protein